MLTIHRAERADALVDALASVIVDPLDDPFTPEVVAVPTRGIERWITQRLSTVLGTSPGRQDGVCANIDFPFPGRVVGAAMAAATGVDPDDDPWLPERAVWPLMAVVDEHLDDAWMAALAAHLGGAGADRDETLRSRRFGAVRHVADLFDRYGVHRPSMIETWANGDDTDGLGDALPGDVVWQAMLWRHLRERLGVPSPAERLAAACARLGEHPDLVDLPLRLSIFGLTRLPASHVGVLEALAAARAVHLFLLHPSPDLWDRVSPEVADHHDLVRRRDDSTAAIPRNPLLATWGRDAREMQLVIGPRGTGILGDVGESIADLSQRGVE